MAHVNVVILNKLTGKPGQPDAREIERVARGLQEQVRGDFGPAWGVDATVTAPGTAFYSHRCWRLMLVDADTAREVTRMEAPTGIVHVDDLPEGSGSWSAEASHVLLELLVDPFSSLAACSGPMPDSSIYALEVCDPCVGSSYHIHDVEVANFVLPSWFSRAPTISISAPAAQPAPEADYPARRIPPPGLDHLSMLERPFQVLDGAGSAGVLAAHSGDPSRLSWRRRLPDGSHAPIGAKMRLSRRETNIGEWPNYNGWTLSGWLSGG